jgi:hypothetical protein
MIDKKIEVQIKKPVPYTGFDPFNMKINKQEIAHDVTQA